MNQQIDPGAARSCARPSSAGDHLHRRPQRSADRARRVVSYDGSELPATRSSSRWACAPIRRCARAGLSVGAGSSSTTICARAPGVWAIGECAGAPRVLRPGLRWPNSRAWRAQASAAILPRPCSIRDDVEGQRVDVYAAASRPPRARRPRRDVLATRAAGSTAARARRRAPDRAALRRRAGRALSSCCASAAGARRCSSPLLGATRSPDPTATVRSCNVVTVGEVQKAIRRDGMTTSRRSCCEHGRHGLWRCAGDVQNCCTPRRSRSNT